MFEDRSSYRRLHRKKGLVSFEITVKETNLNIQADQDLTREAVTAALKFRGYIETHIRSCPEFSSSFAPLPVPDLIPGIVLDMYRAAIASRTGPMAAVAGAVAEHVGKSLLTISREIVVENGGDVFIRSDSDTIFTIYAGESPLSMKAGILVKKRKKPFGLCTSSGTLGHSKSFGKADAVTVLASSCALADAVATALGNRVKTPSDIAKAVDTGKQIPGIEGLVIIKGEHMGLWGDLNLVPLDKT
ncbi:UPF0280 family protein [Desulfospira joergensenii]|uniref:UPF0280 family protein n=1 Tax=Desulfospira joergensenii TaxID=53329 RepID=UPI0003B4BA60|nr:UPF0280 family protein [Desulfospira joergensenii]